MGTHTDTVAVIKFSEPGGRRARDRLTAASTFAGESPFGSASMEMTLIMMVSTV